MKILFSLVIGMGLLLALAAGTPAETASGSGIDVRDTVLH